MRNFLLLAALLPALCLTQLCYFPPAASLSQSCQIPNGEGGCNACKSGYGLMVAQCYPNCPSGWIQLMPSYCINATVVNEHQDFTLCPTNTTMIASGLYDMCYQAPGSTCQCGPACPENYVGIGCYCSYISNASQIQNEGSLWLYIFAVIGMITSVLAVLYTFYQIWKKNVKKEVPQSSTVEITQRRQSLISEKA